MKTAILSFLAASGLVLYAEFADCAPSDSGEVARDLKVGDSRKKVDDALREFKAVAWESLTNYYRLNFLDRERVSAWQVGNGYVLAHFSSSGSLVDLLRFEPQLRLFPLVRGTYSQSLAFIKKGMPVEALYLFVGEDSPSRYHRDASGRWLVEFSYQGVGLDFWLYEADAATGIITKVSVSSI